MTNPADIAARPIASATQAPAATAEQSTAQAASQEAPRVTTPADIAARPIAPSTQATAEQSTAQTAPQEAPRVTTPADMAARPVSPSTQAPAAIAEQSTVQAASQEPPRVTAPADVAARPVAPSDLVVAEQSSAPPASQEAPGASAPAVVADRPAVSSAEAATRPADQATAPSTSPETPAAPAPAGTATSASEARPDVLAALAVNPTGPASPAPSTVTQPQTNQAIAGLPSGDQGLSNANRRDRIRHYVEHYDGGECFFVVPVAVDDASAELQGYGASAQPFEALDAAFLSNIGFEASIGARLVTRAQCPAVTFLGRVRDARGSAPVLKIDSVSLRPGDTLRGTVEGFGNRTVDLLLINDRGVAQNVTNLMRPGATTKSFTITIPRTAGTAGGQPQLLIAVASARPLDAMRPDRPMGADQFFAAVMNEATRTRQSVAAMARYFKIER